jgi:hypothetical protein
MYELGSMYELGNTVLFLQSKQIEVRPTAGQLEDLLAEITDRINKHGDR